MYYKVREGDCISSIAAAHGLLPDTVWLHPDNAALRAKRTDPNILYPGDKLYVPVKQVRNEAATTDERHRFRRKAIPERLRVQLCDEEEAPYTNQPYQLDIDGVLIRGKTDGAGFLDKPIEPTAKTAKVYLEFEEEVLEFELDLGHLHPIDTIEGAQARLRNLDFYLGDINGELDEATVAAVEDFQVFFDLELTSELDQATLSALQQHHHS